eukprot:scaffold73502_cov68-Phaeocystis_antarctica.AAC.1
MCVRCPVVVLTPSARPPSRDALVLGCRAVTLLVQLPPLVVCSHIGSGDASAPPRAGRRTTLPAARRRRRRLERGLVGGRGASVHARGARLGCGVRGHARGAVPPRPAASLDTAARACTGQGQDATRDVGTVRGLTVLTPTSRNHLTVRTGCAYQPPAYRTYLRHRAACSLGGTRPYAYQPRACRAYRVPLWCTTGGLLRAGVRLVHVAARGPSRHRHRHRPARGHAAA